MPRSRATRRLLTHAGRGLLGLIYPPCCLGCGTRTDAATPLCPACARRLERAAPDAVTAAVQSFGVPPARCDAFALWLFDKGGILQHLQHALKYGNRPRYGILLGRLIGEALYDGEPFDAIVPLPLHRTRLLERGYNQSAQLARGIGEVLGTPVDEALLLRARPTRSQTRLSRSARWTNVRDAFEIAAPERLANRRIALVDDVLTTGATAAAAATTLLDAGAMHVTVATLAYAR